PLENLEWSRLRAERRRYNSLRRTIRCNVNSITALCIHRRRFADHRSQAGSPAVAVTASGATLCPSLAALHSAVAQEPAAASAAGGLSNRSQLPLVFNWLRFRDPSI